MTDLQKEIDRCIEEQRRCKEEGSLLGLEDWFREEVLLRLQLMTFREKYQQQLENNFIDCLETMKRKNADYARSDDPFKNFRDSASLAGVSLEQGILLRIGDKLSRYSNLLSQGSWSGQVGETVVDTLEDAMGYVDILKTWHDLGKPEEGQTWEDEGYEDVTKEYVNEPVQQKLPFDVVEEPSFATNVFEKFPEWFKNNVLGVKS